jgi:hypothetical protein
MLSSNCQTPVNRVAVAFAFIWIYSRSLDIDVQNQATAIPEQLLMHGINSRAS